MGRDSTPETARLIARLDGDSTPLGELFPLIVGSQDEIAYHRLPKRARTMFSPRFRQWGDLAGESVDSLRAIPKTGRNTVGSLLMAVHEYVPAEAWDLPIADEDGATPTWVLGDRAAFDGAIEVAARWWLVRFGSTPTLGDLMSIEPTSVDDDLVSAALAWLRGVSPAVEQPPPLRVSVDDLFATLGERQLHILTKRLWTENPVTLVELGEELGVTRERVRQLQAKALDSVEAELASSERSSLRWALDAVQAELGTYLPLEHARTKLSSHGVELDSVAGWFVLDHVGDFEFDDDDWLLDVSRLDRDWYESELTSCFVESVASHEALMAALRSMGVHDDVAEQLLDSEDWLRRLDHDHWLLWDGNAVDRSVVVLQLVGRPMTADEILGHLDEDLSLRSFRNRLSTDPRLMRTGKSTLGLVEWGREEYSGIAEELFERIDRDGGSCVAEELVDELLSTFPDVSESSVRMYTSTLAFVVEDGRIRRRVENDEWPFDAELSKAEGVFTMPDGRLRMLVSADRDLLRGSGRAIPAPLAVALGVRPNDRREFTSATGVGTTVTWRPWATTGPDVGSMRTLAEEASASTGDHVAIDFDPETGSVSARVLRSVEGEPFVRDLVEVGDNADLFAAMAAAIGVPAGEVRSSLRRRGDRTIAEWLPSTVDAQLDGVIAEMIAALD